MGICSVGMDWSNPRLDRPTHLARRSRHWGGVVEDEEWYEVPQVAASAQAIPHADSNRRVWRGCSVAVRPEGSWRLSPSRDLARPNPR